MVAPAPAAALLAGAPPALAREAGAAVAGALRLFDFDVDFAPVVDLDRGGRDNALDGRTFGAAPEAVIPRAAAFLDGLHAGGVGGCVKHFPGLGGAALDTHRQGAEIDLPAAELERDLAPFAALAGRAGAVMIGHAVYPAYDPGRRPATVSPPTARDLLRRRLGFEGLAVSDDLAMAALDGLGGIAERAAAALAAGCDMVIACHRLEELGDVAARLAAPDLAARREEALSRVARYRAHLADLRRRATGTGAAPSATAGDRSGDRLAAARRALARVGEAADEASRAAPSATPEPTEPAPRVVTADEAGATAAALVRALLPEVSWSRARALCESGRLWVDGAALRDPAARLAPGSFVDLRAEGAQAPRGPLAPEDLVHVDPEVVVVDKPAGLLTVPWSEDDRDTLVTLVRALLARRGAHGRGPGPRLRVVQRLDKETSGLLVFARTVAAERHLQQQLRVHSVERLYLAVVHGRAEDATYDTLLLADRGDGLRGSWGLFRRARGNPPETARRAVTHVAVRERLAGATLVECRLETGRQHQIRIHLAEAGHPLVGERVYVRGFAGPPLPAPRPMLHAARLGFVHPRTGLPLAFEAPPPADFDAAVARLRR